MSRFILRQSFAVTAAALAFCTLGVEQARAATIFTDDFDTGASPLWSNEVGDWTAAGGVYNATSPSSVPNANSSLPFSLSDFSVDLDINDVQDGGVWLRSAEATGTSLGRTGVLLITAGLGGTGTGLYWHIVTDGSGYGGILNPVDGLFDPGFSDPHLRIEVSGDTYSAFVNGSLTPATTLTTSDFASGQVGLYDFSNQTFDNVEITTPDRTSVPEPSSLLSLLAVSAFGVGSLRKRKQQQNNDSNS